MSELTVLLSIFLSILYILGGVLFFAVLSVVGPLFSEKKENVWQTFLRANIWPIFMIILLFEEFCEFIKSAK